MLMKKITYYPNIINGKKKALNVNSLLGILFRIITELNVCICYIMKKNWITLKVGKKFIFVYLLEFFIKNSNPLYLSSVIQKKEWKQLKERLYNGENLLILECDGPHQESLNYYKEKYKVNDNFIEKGTILVKCLSVRISYEILTRKYENNVK